MFIYIVVFFVLPRFGGQSPAFTLQLQRPALPVTLFPDVHSQPARSSPFAPAEPHPERGGQHCQARGRGGGQEEGTLLTGHPSTPHLKIQ